MKCLQRMMRESGRCKAGWKIFPLAVLIINGTQSHCLSTNGKSLRQNDIHSSIYYRNYLNAFSGIYLNFQFDSWLLLLLSYHQLENIENSLNASYIVVHLYSITLVSLSINAQTSSEIRQYIERKSKPKFFFWHFYYFF